MKKGFTLIELLAVIVILAVIALIATPIILGLVDDAKKNSFKSSSYGISQAAKNAFIETMYKGNQPLDIIYTYTNGVETSEPLGYNLNYEGAKPQQGYVSLTSEGKVALALYDGKWCATKGYDNAEIALEEKTWEECASGVIDIIDPDITDTYDVTNGVNKPELTEGMIPIYFDGTNWKKADVNNVGNGWYNYNENDRQWANVVTVTSTNRSTYLNASVGTIIPMSDINTMWVWIPRYAYSINNGYRTSNADTVATTNSNATKKINVTFLVGNTNKDVGETEYSLDYDADSISIGGVTPKIVHPGFKFGAKRLTGIWVAKFEASGKNSGGNYVGNASSTVNAEQYAPDSSTRVNILPSAISWRHLTAGESQYRSMKMGTDTTTYGWNNVNSHLIKNNEWGVVAYLSYSQYGRAPMINSAGEYNSTSNYYYNIYTGTGPNTESTETRYTYTATKAYNTTIGQLASTTGNVYGVYDMSGGAWDRIAGYLDNNNSVIDTNGNSTSDINTKYFENGVLKEEYNAYWDKYVVSDEERTNQIAIAGEGTLTQDQLMNSSLSAAQYNTARLRITTTTFNNLRGIKGIGINEVVGSYSYYGTNSTNNTWNWFVTVAQATSGTSTLGRSWNNDIVLIGHANLNFALHGGYCNNSDTAGVFSSSITNGGAYYSYGFRPVLVVPTGI